MRDIIHDDTEVRKRAEALGIQPLIIATDVVLAEDVKERKRAAARIVLATNLDRTLISGPVDGVTRIEHGPRKDHMHFRRGGITQVEAKLLAEQQKAYVVDYASVRTAKDPVTVIGRVVANARICQKFGVPVIFASLADAPERLPAPQDLEAFWRSMGVADELTRASQKAFSEWLKRADHRASDAYIAEGVSKVE